MKIVLIGCGIAGFTAAKNLREKLPSSEITLIDGGTHGLYSRMRLPETLAGTLPEQKLILASPETIGNSGIRFLAGVEAVSIQAQEKTLTLADSRVLSYDRLVLATGAEPSVPPIEGARTDMTLRSIEDVQRYIKLLKAGARATVIGGGLLGLEAAHALRERGMKVAIAEFMPRLLPRQLSEKESEILQKKFVEFGYQIFTGRAPKTLTQSGSGWILRLEDGTEIPSELVLISAGIRPRTALAKAAGATVERGIVVNDRLETSLPDVYAIGDCAQLGGVVYGLWLASKDQGAALAEILAGTRKTFISPVYEPSLKIPGIKLKEIRMAAQK